MNEFRRGWRVLLGAFVGMTTGVSSLYFYSLGIFLKPLGEAFGWSRGQASLGPLVGTLCAAVASPIGGRLIDRVGAVPVAIGSMVMLAAGFAALGTGAMGLGSFLVLTGGVAILSVGSSPISFSRLIVAAFDRHRGLALGLAQTGTGVGAAIMPLLLIPYIAVHGWRAGYLALAVVVLVGLLPVALLLRRPKALAPIRADDATPLREIVRDRNFWRIGLIFFLAAIAVLGTVVHLPAMLSDAGLSPARAGATAAVVGIAVILGRIVTGALLDRFAAPRVTAGLFVASAAGMALLGLGGVSFAIPGALALGLAVGADIDLTAYLVARLLPPGSYGGAYGAIYGLFLLGAAVGPIATGFLFDATNGYTVPLLCSAAVLTVAALLALRLPLDRSAQ